MRDGTKTRQRIQAVALELFAERGVRETTIRDIATAAGVRDGTIYVHWPSKDALAADLFLTHYADFARTLRELAAEEPTFRRRLDQAVYSFCRLFDESPTLFRFLLLNQHDHLERVTSEADNPVAVLRAIVAEGVKDGMTVQDPDLATALIMGMVLQTATFRIYGRLDGSLLDRAEDLARACRRILDL